MSTGLSSARLSLLEERAVAGFCLAVASFSDALEALLAIKDSGAWQDRMVQNEIGVLVPVHTDFARHYLPWFAEEYAHAIGGVSASFLRHRIRWAERCLLHGWTVEESMSVPLATQLTVEHLVEFKDGALAIKGAFGPSHDDAMSIVSGAIDGTLNANLLKSEYDIKDAPYYVLHENEVFFVWRGQSSLLFSVRGIPTEVAYDLRRLLRIRAEE